MAHYGRNDLLTILSSIYSAFFAVNEMHKSVESHSWKKIATVIKKESYLTESLARFLDPIRSEKYFRETVFTVLNHNNL